MNVVFMGTPDFAVPSLKKIAQTRQFNVTGVVTQPDRPKGRGKKFQSSPVKRAAERLSLNIIQPENVNTDEALESINVLKPDVIVVVAFGQILGKNILLLPPKGCINLHASLLPKYRGGAPIHWAVINGEDKTGVTVMFMEEGLDSGDIIAQRETEIGPEETVGELHDRLADMGADLLVDTLLKAEDTEIKGVEQDERLATYAPLLKRKDEKINWDISAEAVVNHIRGMDPWPGAYTKLDGDVLKILRADIYKERGCEYVPGTIVRLLKDKGFIVQTGEGQVLVTEVQPQNKSRMPAAAFVRGRNIEEGSIFLSGGSDET